MKGRQQWGLSLKSSPSWLSNKTLYGVLAEMAWYSDYWKSNMYVVQSRMHPNMWLMMKGKEP
eukprot:12909482-Prorocentrum_lima.AAC.1